MASFLPASELTAWLDKHAEAYRILAPAQEGYAVVFKERAKGQAPLLERSRLSPKGAVIPASENLLSFKTVKDENNKPKLELTNSAQAEAEKTMIFACRSCDARGILALDKPYLSGPYKDPYYSKRREATTIVTLTCTTPCPTCFCTWVGGGPDSTEGADLVITPLSDGFILEAHTEKGQALVSGLTDAGDKLAQATELKTKARESMPKAPDLSTVADRLSERFADTTFWQDHTAKCLACGACTYMCPTCQCFNITDEGDASDGRRLRNWDSCMSSRFTLEASGHNPRTLKAARMRQRVSHKYCYSPKNSGIFSCTGCGRCVRLCPVSLDIREIVLKAIEK